MAIYSLLHTFTHIILVINANILIKYAHLLYLQEELTVFIAMLEYYILSIKQGDEIKKEKGREKTSQEELVSQERASQLK
jgi:hypothetical protein